MTKAKKNAKRPVRISDALKTLIASGAACGYSAAGSFADAVRATMAVVAELPRAADKAKHPAVIDFGLQYKAGYMVRYLEEEKAYLQRVGNMSHADRIADALTVYGKAYPDSSKPDRRTHLEHAACRAADVSWFKVKARAGLVTEKKKSRKPRQGSNAAATPPVDLVKASPKFDGAYAKQHGFNTVKEAANDYFATAAAALLATVNKNARNVTPQISSAVSDLHAALKAAGLIK